MVLFNKVNDGCSVHRYFSVENNLQSPTFVVVQFHTLILSSSKCHYFCKPTKVCVNSKVFHKAYQKQISHPAKKKKYFPIVITLNSFDNEKKEKNVRT